MNTMAPTPGVLEQIAPGVRRILCPNPSPMTLWGTNTFILGEGDVTLIDPGPDMPDHAQAILTSLAPGERVAHILVTHAHMDHSPLARPLSEMTGAPVYGFGPAAAGRSEVMEVLVEAGLTFGGEGIDPEFRPDILVKDGEWLDLSGVDVEAIWTPGHLSNHLSFAFGDAVFVGDHVMAWASSLVSPPDGDLTAFMTSCAKLRARQDRVHYPAHGPQIDDPIARLDWLVAHRLNREASILAALADGPASVSALTDRIYTDIKPALLPAAARNVFAHLIDLTGRGRVYATPKLAEDSSFSLAEGQNAPLP